MPWHTTRSADCPKSKPWAVVKDGDGTVEGCHATEADAKKQQAALYASEEGKDGRSTMTLKAVAVATDQGTFTAVISTESIDREKDIVDAKAMVAALRKWNRPIPLAWEHSTAAEDIIGHIDPQSAEAVDGEVSVAGQVDLESKNGAEAWRSFKSGSIGFSYGYMSLTATKREGGGLHHTELDVFEVSATPAPMNNDTRVTGWKGASSPDAELRKQSGEVERELQADALESNTDPGTLDARLKHAEDAMLAAELFDPEEIEGLKSGRLKAVWSAAYINDLPDSAFLHIEPGGSKDGDGKTAPRSLRHFPYKDTSGKVDLPHLRNALSRIPQSNLSQDVKDRLVARAQRILDSEKSVEATDRTPSEARSVDPLRKRSDEARLEFQSDGLSLRKSPTPNKPEPQPEPTPEADLQRRSRELMLELLTTTD